VRSERTRADTAKATSEAKATHIMLKHNPFSFLRQTNKQKNTKAMSSSGEGVTLLLSTGLRWGGSKRLPGEQAGKVENGRGKEHRHQSVANRWARSCEERVGP